ncbi:MAG: hypothetical protein LC785_06750 [Acidobacteria bacterium]|nr:hypothetical protein [Acidobacteriota bacterium]
MAKRLLFWIIANVLLQFGVPVIYFVYMRRMVDEEYATGMRTSSDGDSMIIPVMGMFIFVLITLLAVNALGAGVYLLRRRRGLP